MADSAGNPRNCLPRHIVYIVSLKHAFSEIRVIAA